MNDWTHIMSADIESLTYGEQAMRHCAEMGLISTTEQGDELYIVVTLRGMIAAFCLINCIKFGVREKDENDQRLGSLELVAATISTLINEGLDKIAEGN